MKTLLNNDRRIVVMGVSGCGKSSVARLLAERLGCDFIEGDDAHPQENIDKMAAGIPLSDADRQDWLQTLKQTLQHRVQLQDSVVLTCSALKRRYRDLLREADPHLFFLHLHGDHALIAQRMASRNRHFMPTALLDSQFADLEPLQSDEFGMMLDVRHSLEKLVTQAIEAISIEVE
ncbi:gluconokinase [uncultured Oxalicibacterium sp.]|uniref:gluconokinase n=1 Tax=uncultured Oxalicibacterium sp. TaxID=1168540 RepID=UPI0025E9A6A1|nr:gluconokinase [uncultured Oxalicibacterium sp.]